MLTDKEVKRMLQDYYKLLEKIDSITEELTNKNEELQSILESLTLTSQELSGMPHGTTTSKPVERIYEEYEKIQKQYADRAIYIRNKLEEYNKKMIIYEKWIEESELTDTEMKVIKYMYKDGLRDWKIGQCIFCSTRSVWNYKEKAFGKLRNVEEACL